MALDNQLRGVDRAVQQIANHVKAGVMRVHPGEYKNPELIQLHKALTKRSADIIERMKGLHAALSQRSEAQ